jgi:CrcB protein
MRTGKLQDARWKSRLSAVAGNGKNNQLIQYNWRYQMQNLLAIALGGALGAALRYGTSGLAHSLFGKNFPWGTLAVNIIGAFLIGLFWPLADGRAWPPMMRAAIFIGFLGAFTTFSTYSLEGIQLLRGGDFSQGAFYILASNIICFIAVGLGLWAGSKLLS